MVQAGQRHGRHVILQPEGRRVIGGWLQLSRSQTSGCKPCRPAGCRQASVCIKQSSFAVESPHLQLCGGPAKLQAGERGPQLIQLVRLQPASEFLGNRLRRTTVERAVGKRSMSRLPCACHESCQARIAQPMQRCLRLPSYEHNKPRPAAAAWLGLTLSALRFKLCSTKRAE